MKDFIKNKIREHLLRENFDISPAELNNLIKLGLETSFDDKSMVKNYLAKSTNTLKNLPDIVTLYRVIFANSKEDINTDEIGSHYVLSRRQLEQTHQQGSHVGGGKPFIVTVKAPKNMIDLTTTLKNKVMYPHENEITLLNNGKGAQVTRIEPFVASDEFAGF